MGEVSGTKCLGEERVSTLLVLMALEGGEGGVDEAKHLREGRV